MKWEWRMPRPSPEALELGSRYRLQLLDPPARGIAGEHLGRGTGASLEFQDRRAYAIGDDVRHLDWRAFARTDQLFVRQYREEIAPRVEIVLDVSRSMAIEPRKAERAVDLAALFAGAASGQGFQVRLALAGERPELVDRARFERDGCECTARLAWPAGLDAALGLLRAGAMRVLISDFLFPHDAAALVRPLAARRHGLALVQVLAGSDLEPPRDAALRLTDSESDAARDIVVDARALARYRQRLKGLADELARECRRAGALFVALDAREPLSEQCRGRLLPSGLLGAS
jgi:uncharacterized protein (DUF58 family)